MYSRRGLIEIFSSFARLDGDRFQGWESDPKLRRSMKACQAQMTVATPRASAPLSDQFWAIYWHKLWQSTPDSLAGAHLSAYLQETCYWVSHKTRSCFVSPHYQLSDCFQIAIAAVPKILKGFNPERRASLKDYASIAFRSIIRDTLRSAREVDICTDWALLRKLSKKRLEEALQNAGFAPETIARYRLAWTCFKTLYVPTQANGTRRLARPDRATWDAIAESYNRDRRLAFESPGPECSPETLEQWLLQCAKFARNHLYPPKTSLNSLKPGMGDREILDDLPAAVNPSLLEESIEAEEEEHRKQQRDRLHRVLLAALDALQPQSQDLLHLYYSQGLTQQQIASQLEMKQYQVSRQLARARESLLKAIAQWSQHTLKIALSSSVLQEASDTLEEWLQGYYAPTTSDRVSQMEESNIRPTTLGQS